MRDTPDLRTIPVIFVGATASAVCVQESEHAPPVWLPRARVRIAPAGPFSTLTEGTPATLTATERIVSAAFNVAGIIWSVPAPGRHHHIIHAADAFGIDAMTHFHPDASGFLTSTGRFVGREEAGRIAVTAGQIEALQWPPELFSEDLW